MKFSDYGTLTVLINGDEEISSPGSRSTITRMAGEHDAVFSYEGGGEDGRLRLATSGIGAAYLTVDGKASHAGSAPDRGVNALYELSHQLLQLSDLSRRDQGLSLNWTVAQAGTNRNVIPAQATAQGDARALKVSDFDRAGGHAAATREDATDSRRQGAAPVRDAPPAAGSHARLAPPGRPRAPPSTRNWGCR